MIKKYLHFHYLPYPFYYLCVCGEIYLHKHIEGLNEDKEFTVQSGVNDNEGIRTQSE